MEPIKEVAAAVMMEQFFGIAVVGWQSARERGSASILGRGYLGEKKYDLITAQGGSFSWKLYLWGTLEIRGWFWFLCPPCLDHDTFIGGGRELCLRRQLSVEDVGHLPCSQHVVVSVVIKMLHHLWIWPLPMPRETLSWEGRDIVVVLVVSRGNNAGGQCE